MGKQDHFPYAPSAAQEHNQSIDTNAETAGRGHAVTEGIQVIVIHGMLLLILVRIGSSHFQEALFLVQGVIQFRKGIAELHTANKTLETLNGGWIVGLTLCQGRDVSRVIKKEGWLHVVWFQQITDDIVDQFTTS